MQFPDVDTLRLCSILASTAFGVVFTVLWLRERSERHFACWGLSSLIYGGAILAFSFTPRDASLFITALYAVLGVSNVLPVCGARVLEGKPAWARWMPVPIVVAFVGHGLPLLLTKTGALATGSVWQDVGDALGLSISMGICGFFLGFSGAASRSSGRRMAGLAMLGYLPGYLLSIVANVWSLPGSEWVALIAMLSDQVLLGVLNLGLLAIPVEHVQRRLRDAALRDALTGAWNRAGLQHIAHRFSAVGTGVIALDVDHFKSVNDSFGHAEGDEVLVTIGAEARQLATRCDGQVVRLGGDEFLVLIPAAHDVRAFAETLHARLTARGQAGAGWSVSMGVSDVASGETSPDDAVRRADASLYHAKSTGRSGISARPAAPPVAA